MDNFWLFLWLVFGHTITLLAGCLVTVLLTLVERHFRKGKPVPVPWDVAILLCFLFFACFQAWREEHIAKIEAASRVAHLEDQDTPKLAGDLASEGNFVSVAPATNSRSIVTISAMISNTGAPSIVTDFVPSVALASGKQVSAKVFIPQDDAVVLWKHGGHDKVVMQVGNELPIKGLQSPVAKGGAIIGFLTMLVDAPLDQVLQPDTVISLSFKDIKGTPYSCSRKMGQQTDAMDLKHLQDGLK